MDDCKTCNIEGLRAAVVMILTFLGIPKDEGLCPFCINLDVSPQDEPCSDCKDWNKFERSHSQ